MSGPLRVIDGGAGEPSVRTPPYSDDAEMALLGALLQNNRAHERVAEFLRPEHFANRIHGRVYEAIGQLIAKGTSADQITLRQFFEADGDLAEVGGWAYIIQLSRSVVSIINVEDYGRTIHDLFLRRQLIELGEGIVNAAFGTDLEEDARIQIEHAEKALAELAGADDVSEPVHTSQGVLELLEHIDMVSKGGAIGIETGIPDLDRLLGGMQPGDFVVLAARPSMGKTDLLGTICDNAARAGIPVALFSLEMSRLQMTARSIARLTGVPASRQIKGNPSLSQAEWDKVGEAANYLSTLPIYIDDAGGISVAQIRARARRLKRKHKIGLVAVDYLQLISADRGVRTENRTQEVSKITQALKIAARDLGVPLIALSQLSRAVESREDKRPHLSDLRESGTIEQDADSVGFIYRPSYYLERAEPQQKPDESGEKYEARLEAWNQQVEKAHGKAEVSFEKVRLGSIGMVELAYAPASSLFSGLHREE